MQLTTNYGYGGTRKAFISKILSAAIKCEIVINVALNGIATLLLFGGRKTHSKFNIVINQNDDSFCSIALEDDLATLLIKSKLIIWYEAPMLHRHYFEAFNMTLRDIIRSSDRDKRFRGNTIVFGGEFRQILPIIQIANRYIHQGYGGNVQFYT